MFSKRPTSSSSTTTTTTSFVGRPISNSIRPPSFTRQQHIDSYRNDPQLAPSTRKVSDDDSTFDTVFQNVSGDTLILRVHWPASLATPGKHSRPPLMTLAGVEARHDWLDARMQVVGYPPLQSMEQWSAANELLGAAVHAVIHHLQLNPPRIVRFVDAGLVAVQSSASINTKQQQQQHNTTTNNNRPNQQQYASHASPPAYHDSMVAAQPPPTLPTVPMPTIPHEFPELEPLTRDQLEVFMSNELEFRSLFQRLPIASAYRQIQHDSDILAASVATAQTNLQSEAELIELSAAVQRLSTELRDRVTAFQALEVQQDAICQPPDATAVCRILQHLKKQAFDESERIADDWLDTPSSSTMTADEFCDRFITARNTHHVRAAKLELLLNNQPQQQRSNHSNSR